MDKDALLAEVARLQTAMRRHADALEGGRQPECVASELRRAAEASRVSVELLDGAAFNPGRE